MWTASGFKCRRFSDIEGEMNSLPKASLLILGHGSSKHPDSSESVRMHADLLSKRGVFADVNCAFLKEAPLIETVVHELSWGRLLIIPDFLSEGYFTLQVIPSLLRLDLLPDTVKYLPPIGTHPMMLGLMCQSAMAVLGNWLMRDVSLLLVGHGSTKNPRSKDTLLGHIEELKKESAIGQVSDLWLEEAPFLQDWRQVVSKRHVIVIPFLLSDGQHGGWDIPEILGLSGVESVHDVTHEVDGCRLRVAPALGASPQFADVIEEVALAALK